VLTPPTCGADVRPRQDEVSMLPYSQQFCKAFLTQVFPAWQAAWAAWRTLRPRRPAHCQRSLHCASPTPRRLASPLRCVPPSASPPPRAAARGGSHRRSGWARLTPRARHPPLSVGTTAVEGRGASEACAPIKQVHTLVVHGGGCTYGRRPAYLRETIFA